MPSMRRPAAEAVAMVRATTAARMCATRRGPARGPASRPAGDGPASICRAVYMVLLDAQRFRTQSLLAQKTASGADQSPETSPPLSRGRDLGPFLVGTEARGL